MTSQVWSARKFKSTSGLLLFLAGSIILMGIITGEIYYPSGYSTRDSEISDLGATRPPNSIITQPSATIFNATMLTTGAMILLAAFFIYAFSRKKFASITMGLLGLGVLGVGIFPGNRAPFHGNFAMLSFISGGLVAIASFQLTKPPLRYIAPVFGLITLISLFFAGYFVPLFGDGGTERWIVYPVVLWLVVFGGYLLGANEPSLVKEE